MGGTCPMCRKSLVSKDSLASCYWDFVDIKGVQAELNKQLYKAMDFLQSVQSREDLRGYYMPSQPKKVDSILLLP